LLTIVRVQGEKKRYCVVKRDEEGKVILELYKQQLTSAYHSTQTLLAMEIKTLGMKTTKKGKCILQVPLLALAEVM